MRLVDRRLDVSNYIADRTSLLTMCIQFVYGLYMYTKYRYACICDLVYSGWLVGSLWCGQFSWDE